MRDDSTKSGAGPGYQVGQASLLIDARDYYRAFVLAAKRAKRSILLSGWQFDTQALLLRGQDLDTDFSYHLLPFLNQLVERNPNLEVHVLAWDYSLVYAIEREWLQGMKTQFGCNERLHFEYLTHPHPGGSHHHKYAVIDEEIAFVGGLDLCDQRWDDRDHRPRHPDRVDIDGKPYKPFHDLQLALTGPIVGAIREIFASGYENTTSQPFVSPAFGDADPEGWDELLSLGRPLRTARAGLSQTNYQNEAKVVTQIEELLTSAIANAERLIYVENQYFTSKALLVALVKRMTDPARSRLDLVFVMPNGADSPKEDFVLGDRQRAVRYALHKVADEHGHRLRFLYSAARPEQEPEVSTFIHAKLMIVDDAFLTVGSANWTNRSMRIDSELNVSVEAGAEASEDLECDIRKIRATLLSEHAGSCESGPFEDPRVLIDAVDRSVADPNCKLRHLDLEKPDDDDPLLVAIFDPSGGLSVDILGDALKEELEQNSNFFQRGLETLGQRLGIIDPR